VSLVLDSSATLAWIYGDETPEQNRRVFQAIAEDGAVVPALWRLEIANSLNFDRASRSHRCVLLPCRSYDLAFWDIKTRSAVRLKLSLVVTLIRPLGGHRELRPSVRIASWRQGQPNRGGHEYRSVFRSAHIHVV
jgi:hypothetical protein